jgi:F420-dependent oxidoreductase-like protein
VEGWYGQPYGRPLARTREYVEIVRRVVARQAPLEFDGAFYQHPLPGGTGLGKPLKSTLHPQRDHLPIYLAAEGPKNVALSAEICDGWLPLFFAPKDDAFYRSALQAGFDAAGKTWEGFEVAATVPLVPGEDVERCADLVRPMLALYIGGMGARGQNFHFDVFVRMGYEAECHRIQDLYLAGDKATAIATVPTSMVEAVALVGPPAKIKDELAMWEESVVTTLLISGPVEVVRLGADLVLG